MLELSLTLRSKNLTLLLSKFKGKLLILGFFHEIAIVERVLTGKLLTSELPTGIFSTDKVVCNTVIKVLPTCYLNIRGHAEITLYVPSNEDF